MVYPGTFVKSLAFIVRDVMSATASQARCKVSGRPRRQAARSQFPDYEVIPASHYLKAALARRARLASLRSINE